MCARKSIGCIIVNPEAAYQQRLLKGIQAQVAKYDCDLQVFTPLVSLGTPFKDYVEQDLNILNLINFDILDGVLVCPRTFLVNSDLKPLDKLENLLKKKCKKPVVCLDIGFSNSNYPVTQTDKKSVFKEIADFLFVEKKCKSVIYLSGVSEDEKINEIYKVVLARGKKAGISKENIKLANGDYWYTGGKKLADKFISKELELPDAVICENDYMALGLEDHLRRAGIKCPDDLYITGYEATQDAFLNDITITSYVPREERMAMEAVNRLMKEINPAVKTIAPKPKGEEGLIPAGSTDSLMADVKVYKRAVRDWIYKVNRNEDEWNAREFFDIGRLMESYMFEELTEKNTPLECLYRIFCDAYLLEPYSAFYMNLCPDWLDPTVVQSEGYPPEMIRAIDKVAKTHPNYVPGVNKYTLDKSYSFKTKKVLPAMSKPWKKPQTYYFIPLHFSNNTFGYAVLQFDAERLLVPTAMHRNWFRNVQNAMEMTRTKNKLYSQSLIDGLTGVFNRNKFKDLCTDGTKALVADNVGIMMLDIDFFKNVNDTYGHTVGDEYLRKITQLAKSCIRESDMIIRWGGEEFVIFCLGCTDEERLFVIAEKIRKTIADCRDLVSPVTVSIGISVYDGMNYESSVEKADEALYYAKQHGRNKVVVYSKIK